MTSDMERVWNRIKLAAHGLARDLRGSLDIAEARAVVIRLCREEHAGKPPDEALDYLAKELVDFIEAARNGTNAPGPADGHLGAPNSLS